MKPFSWLVTGITCIGLTGCGMGQGAPVPVSASKMDKPNLSPKIDDNPSSPEKKEVAQSEPVPFKVMGKTQCVFGRKAIIAPVPLHTVVEVLVKPGDKVKKGQLLVKLDDDEPQADVRNKQALLESARATLKESRRHFAAVEKLYEQGAISIQSYYAIRTTATKADHDEKAAAAALEAAKAELEHYAILSQIDGVISRLDVYPGTVSRPGTTVWGEILDLSVLDVRCELTPEQADQVALAQPASIWVSWRRESCGVGEVVFVGIAADKQTGLVPVLVRLGNAAGQLRCEIPVQVNFSNLLVARKKN